MKLDLSDLQKTLEELLKDFLTGKSTNTDSSWSLTITKIANGYTMQGYYGTSVVVEDSDTDPLASGEKLLCGVMEHFNLGGSKHDAERLSVTRIKKEEEKI